MQKISERLEIMPDTTTRELRKIGNSDYIDKAIDALVARGHLREIAQGKGRPTLYKLLKPYAADAPAPEPA